MGLFLGMADHSEAKQCSNTFSPSLLFDGREYSDIIYPSKYTFLTDIPWDIASKSVTALMTISFIQYPLTISPENVNLN